MPVKDPMRWARAEAVRQATLQRIRFCVMQDYQVYPLIMRPRDQQVLGVAYPDEYRFIYCNVERNARGPTAPLRTPLGSTVGARSMPELA
ncbi:MAG: hypothetical protein P8N76_15675 [Pirellulaceae bacterium]|nr:hypothetical protein [Pirellulaceae bacterium]